MATAPAQDRDYGRLCVAFDGDVRNYALAPEATLDDVVGIFAVTTPIDARRLRSVQITIVSELRSLFSDEA